MRVKMRTFYAGPLGSAPPGGVLTVSDAEGAALIAANFAEAIPEPETATAPAEEVATEPAADVAETAAAPPPETATAPRSTRRRGR